MTNKQILTDKGSGLVVTSGKWGRNIPGGRSCQCKGPEASVLTKQVG